MYPTTITMTFLVIMISVIQTKANVIHYNTCHRGCRNRHSFLPALPRQDTADLMEAFINGINDVKEKVVLAINDVVENNFGGDAGYLHHLRIAGESELDSFLISSQIDPMTRTSNQMATLALYFRILNWEFIKDDCDMDFGELNHNSLPLLHWRSILCNFDHHVPQGYCRKSFELNGINSCSSVTNLVYVILESSREILDGLNNRTRVYKSILESGNDEREAMRIILNSHIM